jgi:hypothetical protein
MAGSPPWKPRDDKAEPARLGQPRHLDSPSCVVKRSIDATAGVLIQFPRAADQWGATSRDPIPNRSRDGYRAIGFEPIHVRRAGVVAGSDRRLGEFFDVELVPLQKRKGG